MDPIVTAAIIGVIGTVIVTVIRIVVKLLGKKHILPPLAAVAVRLGYSIQELFAILDTADPRIYSQDYESVTRKVAFDECISKISLLCNISELLNTVFKLSHFCYTCNIGIKLYCGNWQKPIPWR